jgi:hypothetical protein
VFVLREINQAEREMCSWQLNVDPATLGPGSTPRLARVLSQITFEAIVRAETNKQ